ncbi:MAG: outer membrane protein transport protein [Acidobacteriota bacterium]
MRRRFLEWTAILVLAVALGTAPTYGAAFGIFEQGTKAMGMAGAFTAQADDGSAIFHNVAGLGFQTEGGFYVGTTLITISESTFEGANPFPGEGVSGEQKSAIFFPSHVYYVRPMNERVVLGFGLNNPFALATDWDDPDEWAGRFISNHAELRTFDLSANLGWRLTNNFSLGFGLIYRLTEVTLERHVPSINPFTQQVIDIAAVELESDLGGELGFSFGFLHKPNPNFSWGFSYRGAVEADLEGDGNFTQISTGNAALDAIVATQLPFDQAVGLETTINFPDMASLGFALQVTNNVLVEVDINWTGWSEFDTVFLDFDVDTFDQTLEQEYEDAYNYRIGAAIDTSSGNQWRIGFVYDETPQPDESVGPLLPDADRFGITLGYGWQDKLDLALMYLPFDERSTDVNRDNFNGTYETTAWLLGISYGF